MLTSTNTSLFRCINDLHKVLQLIKDAGFDSYDISLDDVNCELMTAENYRELAREYRKFADSINLPCNQSHAPFPSVFEDEAKTKWMFDEIVKAMEIASILGAKCIVVHPGNNLKPEENKAFYNSLLPYAIKFNIKIAVENMWNWNQGEPRCCFASCATPEDYLANIEPLDPRYFTCCLDIGHAEMFDDIGAPKLIYALGHKYVGALHIHDNDHIHDCHQVPFTMAIDYEPIIQALRDIDYQGDVTLEIVGFASDRNIDEFPEATKKMCEAARYLRKRILEDK